MRLSFSGCFFVGGWVFGYGGLGFQAAFGDEPSLLHWGSLKMGLLLCGKHPISLTMRFMPAGHLLFFASPKCEPVSIIHATAFAP